MRKAATTVLRRCGENSLAAWASVPPARGGTPCLRPVHPTTGHAGTSTATCPEHVHLQGGLSFFQPLATSCISLVACSPSHSPALLPLTSTTSTFQITRVWGTRSERQPLKPWGDLVPIPCNSSAKPPRRLSFTRTPRAACFINMYHQLSMVQCHYLSHMLLRASTPPARALARSGVRPSPP
jgi:hypothetical protein